MNAIQQVPSQQLAPAWTPDQVKVLKEQIAKDCTDDELMLFGYVCNKTGLDPFSRQIYAIKRGGKMTIQSSIDGLRLIAHRTGSYTGSETYWCGSDGVWSEVWLPSEPPSAAKVVVYKGAGVKGFVGVARFKSYSQKTPTWSSMPDVMIAKCAEALALRKAFPAELSGLYATEEMEQADKQPRQVAPAQDLSTVFSNFQAAVQAELDALATGKTPAAVKKRIQHFAKSMRERAGSSLDQWSDDINEVEMDAIASISATDIKEVE